MLKVSVTQEPFSAGADGKTDDRKAIQSAIDYACSQGGGTVVLDAGKTFLSSGSIVMRDGVTLFFGDGALLQQSGDASAYVKPVGDRYEHYEIIFGHNYSEKIKWSHVWYKNYPFIFAPEGTRNFAVRGKGTIRMADGDDSDKVIKTCPVGFYRVSDFEIADIEITNYHGYAMMPFTCRNGVFRNLVISGWTFGNGDGICMMNCRDMRVTGCRMFTGDDAVYIFSSYKDPRKSEWWSSDEPQPSENIEIDSNNLRTNHCKAFGMILWGIDCPDPEKTEVRNIYVHDNYFETMGNWLYNPYTTKTDAPPVTNVRFENNVIDGIESNFFETVITDMTGFRSARHIQNGNFADGRVFWSYKNENRVSFVREDENYALISGDGSGEAEVYQGLYIDGNSPCIFEAELETGNTPCLLFVRNTETGETIASVLTDCKERSKSFLHFQVPEGGNYHIGIRREAGSDESVKIFSAKLTGNLDNVPPFGSFTATGGKLIFNY